MKYAILGWTGRRSKGRTSHLILWRADGTVRKGDLSFCGMVTVGSPDWKVQPTASHVCKKCRQYSVRYEEIQRRMRFWR